MTTYEKLAALATEFELSPGSHASTSDGMCAMELVAFLDGAPHSDRPRRTCWIIGDFVRHLNDNIPDALRPRLLPYIPRLVDTASVKYEQQRFEYFAWQTIRVFAPAALLAQGHRRFATVLANSKEFWRAKVTADIVRLAVARREVASLSKPSDEAPTPVDLALHRAFRAAGAAENFAKPGIPAYWDEYSSCGYAAASAAYQASRAGCAEAWDLAFATLEGALAIGSSDLPQNSAAGPRRLAAAELVQP